MATVFAMVACIGAGSDQVPFPRLNLSSYYSKHLTSDLTSISTQLPRNTPLRPNRSQSDKLMVLPWLKIIADNGADIYVGVRYYVDHFQGVDNETFEVFSIQGDEGIGGCDNSADATFALCVLSVIFGCLCTLMNAHRVYDLDAYESEAWEVRLSVHVLCMFCVHAA
jgi:hypothetical protein